MIEFSFEPLELSLDEEYITAQLTQLGSRSVTGMTALMNNSPPTGRRYGNHVASSPGNAPRNDTGGLRQSLAFDAAGRQVEIGSPLEYLIYLEDSLDRPLLEMGVNKTIMEWPDFMSDFVRVE